MFKESSDLVTTASTSQVRLLEVERRFMSAMKARFGQRFERYREDWELSSKFEYLPDYPLTLDIEVNASCNMRCIMCPVSTSKSSYSLPKTTELDMRTYQRIIDESAEHGLPALNFGFISEPLLRKDLPKMIRMARNAGIMDISLGTNGQALNRKMSYALIEAGLTRLEVSVDAASTATYSTLRQGGSLITLEKNIKNFQNIMSKSKTTFPVLRLSFVTLPFNKHELNDFLKKWYGLVDTFSIQKPIYFEEAPISGSVMVSGGRIPEHFKCAQPWQRLSVRADGSIYPCCSISGLGMPIGSVNGMDIATQWHLPMLNSLRKMHAKGFFSDHPVCKECAARLNMDAKIRSMAAA